MPALLRKMSPYFMVHAGLPPFLLLHGAADEQVPYPQSPRFCEALPSQREPLRSLYGPGCAPRHGPWARETVIHCGPSCLPKSGGPAHHYRSSAAGTGRTSSQLPLSHDRIIAA